MRIKAIASFAAAVALTGILGMVFFGANAAGKRAATMTNLKGTVKVKVAGTPEWVVATDRMTVSEGDEIRTEGQSSVILKMDDGTMVKLGPLAKMKLDQLSKSGDNNKTAMGVEVGKTWNRVNKLTGDAAFSVKTPTAVAGVRGTFFSSEVAETSNSTFDVFDGQVVVSGVKDPSAEVSVGAGMRTAVAPGQAPAAPSQIPTDALKDGKDGFSNAEAAMATYDLQIAISPQVVEPGQKATVSVQVFKNGQPLRKEVNVKLTLSGAAKFAGSDSNELELTTDEQGAATAEITSGEKETVTVSAELRISVPKN